MRYESLLRVESRAVPGVTFRLQPYLTLLALRYPVDDLRLRVNELPEGHAGSSNAVLRHRERRAVARHSLKAEPVFVAVHRQADGVYFRRLDAEEYRLLDALRAGQTVGDAIETAFAESTAPVEDIVPIVQQYFTSWAELGWFCRPGCAGATL